jgi:transcriptional regulator with XRE-family HTH domain
MNAAFPRIITLLRKERGTSQKQVSVDLEVSQALLSHYEKGIRECGLDFVVKAADYYGVSCDYLLGRTADKSGAMIAVDEIPDNDPTVKENKLRGSVLPVLNKKLVMNSLQIIFDLLQRYNNKGLTTEVSAYLSLTVYSVFRLLYDANEKNPSVMFSVQRYMFQPTLVGELSKTAAKIAQLTAGETIDGEPGVDEEHIPNILPDNITNDYPLFASSLFNLLRNAETRLK